MEERFGKSPEQGSAPMEEKSNGRRTSSSREKGQKSGEDGGGVARESDPGDREEKVNY